MQIQFSPCTSTHPSGCRPASRVDGHDPLPSGAFLCSPLARYKRHPRPLLDVAGPLLSWPSPSLFFRLHIPPVSLAVGCCDVRYAHSDKK